MWGHADLDQLNFIYIYIYIYTYTCTENIFEKNIINKAAYKTVYNTKYIFGHGIIMKYFTSMYNLQI